MEIQDIKDTMDYFKCVFILEALQVDLTHKSTCVKHMSSTSDAYRMESIYKLYVYPAAMYREYLNNYLTVKVFAEHYNFTESVATDLINYGREIHEKYVMHYKILNAKQR